MDELGRLERLISPVALARDDRRRTPRDWVVDVLCVLVAAAIGAVALESAKQAGMSHGLADLDFLLGAAALVTLFWRRRRPVALLLAVSAISPLSAASAGAAVILLFTVAVHRPVALALGVTVVSLLPLPAYYLLHPGIGDVVVDSAFGIGFSLLAVAWGMYVRARRQLVLSLAERARDAEAGQAARARRARGDERARIAREMHDVLGHRLSLLALHAGALEYRPDAPPEEVARAAGIIRGAAHDALTELRAAIGVLHAPDGAPLPEPPQPTLAEIERLLGECRAAGVRVDATVDVATDAMPVALGRNAYRIVQEGLTNARRHAPGARVDVILRGTPGTELAVVVRNPLAVGVAAQRTLPGAGTGLVGLRERAALAGGRLESAETADGAWELRAWLPWPV